MSTGYLKVCPKCGGSLSPVALDPQSAPWLCAGCRRGFWATELSSDLRARYRPRHDDFGLGAERLDIVASITSEINAANARGTSLREDQIEHADLSVLRHLSSRSDISAEFKTLLDAHFSNAGGES